jgi:hypothetical protein
MQMIWPTFLEGRCHSPMANRIKGKGTPSKEWAAFWKALLAMGRSSIFIFFISFKKNAILKRNPISEKNELFDLEWEPIGSEFKYLDINEDLQMQKGFPFPERMNFWQQLTKKKKPTKVEL